jgi:membrane protein implicated in regulation of membrane protease activity
LRFKHTTTQSNNKELSMTKNVGNIERAIRILAGLALMGLAATGTIGVWGWIGLAPLATGLTGWCPPYALLGFSTCAVKKD